MVFVRRVRTGSGATAVQIAERRGGRDRVLEHLGSAHTEAELTALLEVARRRIYPGQAELNVATGVVPGGDAVITGKSCAVLWAVLTGAYTRLGFDALGDESFQQLVLARIVEPTSKADSLRVLDELGVPHAALRTMFRSLARCNEQGYREQLADACLDHASTVGDVSLVLYDVSTRYFEADKEDNLRKVGYSKERKVDPQIVIGLLVDRGGFPLEIGCFEGNTAETTTLIPIIEEFTRRHGLAGMVVVADAGMLSAANLRALDDAGLGFIVGSRSTKAPVDLASHFRWHGDAFVDGQLIDTITPRVTTRAAGAVSNPAVKAEPVWAPTSHAGSWRAVWAYSAKRAVRDNRTLNAQEDRARAVVNGHKSARTPRFVTAAKGSTCIDEASLARARALVGLKGYVTNLPADLMPAREVVANYHDLWHVEAAFRLSKHDLAARPIFHHTRDAIEAHLTIVFAALAITRHLQDTTGLSIKKIIHALRPLQHVTINIAGHEHTAADPLTPQAQRILEATATPWPTH